LPGERVTKTLVTLLGQAPPATQGALLSALNLRADPAACEAVLKSAQSSEPAVRLAALKALTNVGDERAVPVLADTAATATADEQKALERRHRVCCIRAISTRQCSTCWGKAQPRTQAELIKERSRSVVTKKPFPAFFALTQQPDEGVQTAAVRAIGTMGDETCVDRLMELFLAAKPDSVRDAAEDAIVAVAANAEKNDAIVAKLLAINPASSAPVRVGALRAAARIRLSRQFPWPSLEADSNGSPPISQVESIRCTRGILALLSH
jgi:HEAT repeat protein